MEQRAQFEQSVAEAYDHLYDLVFLRTHPLADLIIPDPAVSRREKAWQLNRILTEVVEELNPGPRAPVFSRAWRRHRLMVLRYVDGLDPQAVADQLAISRRHFYREHEAAIQAIASILWNRYVARATPPASPQTPASPDRIELLRLEAARANQASRYVRLSETIASTIPLVREMAHRKEVDLHVELEADPEVGVDRNLLRQILLGLLSALIDRARQGEIEVGATAEDDRVRVRLRVHRHARAAQDGPEPQATTDLTMLQELAAMQDARITDVHDRGLWVGFDLTLPTTPARTILVVDDNADVRQLFQRYLVPHHYRVVTAQTGAEAIRLAQELQPFAITLDLMLPGQDGWDVLQVLANQPQTAHIPVIVCTVLNAKELALSLGAAAFLEKPVTDQALLTALQALAS